MEYFSLTNPNEISTFSNAVVNGIAPDRGLYFPKEIPQLQKHLLSTSIKWIFMKWRLRPYDRL